MQLSHGAVCFGSDSGTDDLNRMVSFKRKEHEDFGSPFHDVMLWRIRACPSCMESNLFQLYYASK